MKTIDICYIGYNQTYIGHIRNLVITYTKQNVMYIIFIVLSRLYINKDTYFVHIYKDNRVIINYALESKLGQNRSIHLHQPGKK